MDCRKGCAMMVESVLEEQWVMCPLERFKQHLQKTFARNSQGVFIFFNLTKIV